MKGCFLKKNFNNFKFCKEKKIYIYIYTHKNENKYKVKNPCYKQVF